MTVKFMSPERLPANQQNAQKSTGPKTPTGKQASSRNAIKHGLLARSIVIESPDGSEDRADFDSLLADLCEELNPRGLIEQTLVERIATCYWRLHRAQRFENGAIRERLESPETHDDFVTYYEGERKKQEKCLFAMDRLTMLFAIPLEHLTQPEKQEIAGLLEQLPSPCPDPLLGMGPAMNPEEVREQLPVMRATQLAMIDQTRERLKQAQEKDALRQSRKSLTGSLPDNGNLLTLIRYETMLDRQIHRALTELRRHRERGPLSEIENHNL